MKKFLKIVLCIFILFVLIMGGFIFYLSQGVDSGSKMVINNISPSQLSDGTYSGKYDGGRWTNEVSVTVKDHKITKVDVIKDVAFPKPEVTSELFNKVIQKQNLNVDVTAGATVTCKAYLKAIENALGK